MEANKVYQMQSTKVYPLLADRAERKEWTGYTPRQLAAVLASDIIYGDFFRNAPQLIPNRRLY